MTEKSKLLYYLMTGFQKWEERKGTIPSELRIGHQKLIQALAMKNELPPTDLPTLIQYLMKPVNEWGVDLEGTTFPPDACLIDKTNNLTFEAEDFLNDYISPDEDEQSVMKRLLNYCKVNNLDNEYRDIRIFLSKEENAIITSFTLWQFKQRFRDQQLSVFIELFYEEIHSVDEYKICPNCHWTLAWKKGNWRCSKENICHALVDFERLEKVPSTGEQYLRLKTGIHKYILLPGMAELKIVNQLEEKGYACVLYPNVDQYDIQIKTSRQLINLDVKDYHNPYQLAQNIKEKIPIKDLEKCWIVVPTYRERIFPQYVQRLYVLLGKTYRRLKIVLERDLYKEIERGIL